MSKRTSIQVGILAALALGAVALAAPAQAQSCSQTVAVHSSYPADGATGVPTNAPLFIYGPALDTDSDITLTDASGTAVSIDVQPAEGGVLVDAFLGLTASTTYEVSVSLPGAVEWSASFTTGTGPATIAQLSAPDVGVSLIEQDGGGCTLTAICVIGSVSTRRTLEVKVGNEVMSLGGGEPPPAFLSRPGAIASNGCVEVRVREPGGAVSETTRLCGAELGRFELAASAAAPTSCQAYAALPGGDDSDSSEDSGGCALGAPGASEASRAAAGAGLFALLAALFSARRRGGRRA